LRLERIEGEMIEGSKGSFGRYMRYINPNEMKNLRSAAKVIVSS
jgi:hypothetical protein